VSSWQASDGLSLADAQYIQGLAAGNPFLLQYGGQGQSLHEVGDDLVAQVQVDSHTCKKIVQMRPKYQKGPIDGIGICLCKQSINNSNICTGKECQSSGRLGNRPEVDHSVDNPGSSEDSEYGLFTLKKTL
jgi:hypothetical protein